MQQGAPAAIYYGERLYQFPLGILGMAVATAIFPLLSRHAARGDHRRVGVDLTLGLRLVLALGIPAGVGLILLAEPLARLLFQHGEFDAEDTVRAAGMIACYAGGVWAFCALPVLVRGFYALGDLATPVRIGLAAVGLNLALNLTLIWPLAERGLAVATAVAAAAQVLALAVAFSRRQSRLDWSSLGVTVARSLLATAVMAVACRATLDRLAPGEGLSSQLLRVALPLAAAATVYCVVFRALGGREIGMLLARHPSSPIPPATLD
jgi:putative peptidoglycan lipid II flippase